MKQIKHVVLT